MSSEHTESPTFTPFWPLLFMGISLTLFFGWQVVQNFKQHTNTVRLTDQQALLSAQAVEAEAKLQALMMDLIKLAETDPDAEDLVKQFGIKFNPAAAPVNPASPAVVEPAPAP